MSRRRQLNVRRNPPAMQFGVGEFVYVDGVRGVVIAVDVETREYKVKQKRIGWSIPTVNWYPETVVTARPTRKNPPDDDYYETDEWESDDDEENEAWVDVWEERDNLQIVLYFGQRGDPNSSEEIAMWTNDDARQMFEDGFFDSRRLKQSVVEYAYEVGLLDRHKR